MIVRYLDYLVTLARDRPFDLVIMKWRMTGMDGYNDHIAKPIDVPAMYATLSRWIRR